MSVVLAFMSRLEKEFLIFHFDNPHIAEKIRQLIRNHRRISGIHSVLGIAMLWEVMRWDFSMITHVPEGVEYKLCNNHRAYYARLIMEEEEFEGVFNIRELRSS